MRPEDEFHEPVKDPYPIPPPIKIDIIHAEWAIDVKISNDNTKGEKRVTVHVRSDGDPDAAQKLAHKLYAEELSS